MKRYKALIQAIIFSFLMLFLPSRNLACSMFKITMFGKTMVGNNEDARRLNSKIWFERGEDGNYGAAYVGHNDLFAQGGINEVGLAFDGFAVYPKKIKPFYGKKLIENTTGFIKRIMQTCRSVEEVQLQVNQYDRSVFINSMLLFVDNTGKYLVVEVDTTIIGNDAKYVLSNFCPSITPDLNSVTIDRYQRGRKFLKNKSDTSLNFCLAAMDTMHECGRKIGDGTVYTSIYDLNEGIIYLYFYHDFKHVVTFNLKQELAKGNHTFNMPSLFPLNKEYNEFSHYRTPFNSPLRWLLIAIAIFLLASIFYFFFNKNKGLPALENNRNNLQFLLVSILLINFILVIYIYILNKNEGIFYIDAPYKISSKWFFNISAYIPVALLIFIFPVVFLNTRAIQTFKRFNVFNIIFSLNILCYISMLLLFAYWKLYNIF